MRNTAAILKDYADECMDPDEHYETLYYVFVGGRIHCFINIYIIIGKGVSQFFSKDGWGNI